MTAQKIVDDLNHGKENYSLCCKLEDLIDNNNTEEAINCIQEKFNCDNETAKQGFIKFKKQIYDEFKKIENENPLTPEQIAHNNAVARELLNKPKCLTCGSTNVKKIGAGERVVSVSMFGIYSKKINKSFKCKNCGYTW